MKKESSPSTQKVIKVRDISQSLIQTMHQSDATKYTRDEIVKMVAEWSQWRQIQAKRNLSAWTGTEDWDVRFLKWAIKGRVKEFVQYCEKNPSPESTLALEGVWSIYDKKWPHSSVTGYIFGYVWGWLQLELEKPGEEPPMSIEDQKTSLRKECNERGVDVIRFSYDGYGGVKAITKEE